MSNYWSMKEIGQRVGLTSHQVGKMLKEVGFRTPKGKPSREAFSEGRVAKRWAEDGEHYLWAWESEWALRFFTQEESQGHSS